MRDLARDRSGLAQLRSDLRSAGHRSLQPQLAGVLRPLAVELRGLGALLLGTDFCASAGATALGFRVCKTAVVVPGAIVHSAVWPACFDSAPCRCVRRFLPCMCRSSVASVCLALSR